MFAFNNVAVRCVKPSMFRVLRDITKNVFLFCKKYGDYYLRIETILIIKIPLIMGSETIDEVVITRPLQRDGSNID